MIGAAMGKQGGSDEPKAEGMESGLAWTKQRSVRGEMLIQCLRLPIPCTDLSSAYMLMTKPGVQNPHCEPWLLESASCTGCRPWRTLPRPAQEWRQWRGQ